MHRCGACNKRHEEQYTNCSRCRATSRRWKHQFWYKHLLQAHKHNDIRKGIYDADNFCTGSVVLEMLHRQKGECWYCTLPMVYPVRSGPDGLTIQRLDNALGHIVQNCVLCCKSCNLHRVELGTAKSRKYLKDRIIEVEWFHLVRGGYQCLGDPRACSFSTVV